ncbi:hypothetical protein [Marinobacterium aestuariivivens]|uniref:Uncharacterized protein n=1 Tax=Marinobacterium aestuariivivens TaxID=1698799 RepID=A0ABW2A706_9GAMM
MTFSNRQSDTLEETLGISFGTGIDCEAHYRLFCLYNAHGGQEGISGLQEAPLIFTSFRRSRLRLRQRLLGGGHRPSSVATGGRRPGRRGSRFRLP